MLYIFYHNKKKSNVAFFHVQDVEARMWWFLPCKILHFWGLLVGTMISYADSTGVKILCTVSVKWIEGRLNRFLMLMQVTW